MAPKSRRQAVPKAAQLLKQVHALFLHNRLCEHPADQQAAVRQCLGKTLVSVVTDASTNANAIHAELCCALFFRALLRWQCKPDAALVQDVTTRVRAYRQKLPVRGTCTGCGHIAGTVPDVPARTTSVQNSNASVADLQ